MVRHDSEVTVVMETRLVTKAGHRVRMWRGEGGGVVDREMHVKQHKHSKRWRGRGKGKVRVAKRC